MYVPSNQGGVYKSTDRGASWTKISVPFQQVFTVFASATDLYVTGGKDLWDRSFKIPHASLQNDTVWIDDPVPSGLTFASSGIKTGAPGWGVATSDGTHTILVTSNYTDGAWRYVVPK